MSAALHLAVVLLLCLCGAPALLGARWTRRHPGRAVLTWQLLLLTAALSLTGLLAALGLLPYGTPLLPATAELLTGAHHPLTLPHHLSLAAALLIPLVFAVALAACLLAVRRVRRRHRTLLTLLGQTNPAAPGAVVLDLPAPLAYCIPGRPPVIVLSSAAVHRLTPGELAAVLGHERAHAQERHDLALLPFTALTHLLPRAIAAEVALLLEMRADDLACRNRDHTALCSALRWFRDTTLPTPPGALGASADIDARLARIGQRPETSRLPWLVVTTALVLAATPVSLFLWPY